MSYATYFYAKIAETIVNLYLFIYIYGIVYGIVAYTIRDSWNC